MPFIVIDRERYALPIGDSILGGSAVNALSVPALAAVPPSASVWVGPDGTASIRRIGTGEVTVNGAPIGSEAVRLIHGCRLELSGLRILFGDIAAAGSTVHISGVSDDELALLSDLRPIEPTSGSGGRLIAERDGTIHHVPDDGLEIGRDPACGIALSGKDVSRRHARVEAGLLGYVLTDLSANGVYVNGARVEGSRVLGNGDVVTVGTERFRFEAEAASFEPLVTRVMPLAPQATRVLPASPPRQRPAPVLLATLEIINEGILKGTRFRIEQPATHLGRASHNEIGLSDDSVSSAHATLTRRAKGWFVADLDSTNGTYVDGVRINGELKLDGVSEIRLGNIKMVFRPFAGAAAVEPSTRGVVGVTDDHLKKTR
jgi:pSer/pThr/pTyr-binding forkhead associated (FHA) protein